MSTKDNQAYEEAMDDVHTRFILNLPDEELQSAPRIFFQLEQAWWFYDDFICDGAVAAQAAAEAAEEANGKKKSKKKKPEPILRFKHVKPFSLAMFKFSPLLQPMIPQFESMYGEFNTYKRSISTYGTILLNKDATKVALCRVYKGKGWMLPGGKVNQDENGKDAAARETYEETGFDPEGGHGVCANWMEMRERGEVIQELVQDDDVDAPSDEEEDGGKLMPWEPLQEENKVVYTENDTKKRRTCYVCRGVPENFPFEPVARKEISEVSWHDLTNLPKHTYAVLPFLGQLRKWIKRDNRKRGIEHVRGNSRAGSRSRQKEYAITPTAILTSKSTPTAILASKRRGSVSSSGKPPANLEDVGLTPFFSDDGNAPWEDGKALEKKEDNVTESSAPPAPTNKKEKKPKESISSPPPTTTTKKEKNKKKKRPNSRSGSRGQEVALGDPLVESALASPGESNRWTEDEMFLKNEQITGRSITYDGNPHDFAEKGFDGFAVVGEGRVDPHAFRVVGGTFMNSEKGGVLSKPPEKGALQPLMTTQHQRARSDTKGSSVSGLSGDVDDVLDMAEDGLGALTPFFSDDGKAPWEEGLGGLEKHVTPPRVRGAPMVGQSNSKGLALLNRLRQGGHANEEGDDDDGVAAEEQQAPPSLPASKKEKKNAKKDKKKKSEKKTAVVDTTTTTGKTEDSTDWFMTDKEITSKSQKEKLSILPPSPFPSSAPTKLTTQQAVSYQNNEHLVWMKQWVQQSPKPGSTKEFGDFRLDVNAVMNAMAVTQS